MVKTKKNYKKNLKNKKSKKYGGNLPEDWEEFITPSGYKYYYNHRTKVTQWDKPQEYPDTYGIEGEEMATYNKEESVDYSSTSSDYFQTQKTPTKSPKSSEVKHTEDIIPEGWERGVTSEGQVYYIDHINKKTQWEYPSQKSPKYPQTPKYPKTPILQGQPIQGQTIQDQPIQGKPIQTQTIQGELIQPQSMQQVNPCNNIETYKVGNDTIVKGFVWKKGAGGLLHSSKLIPRLFVLNITTGVLDYFKLERGILKFWKKHIKAIPQKRLLISGATLLNKEYKMPKNYVWFNPKGKVIIINTKTLDGRPYRDIEIVVEDDPSCNKFIPDQQKCCNYAQIWSDHLHNASLNGRKQIERRKIDYLSTVMNSSGYQKVNNTSGSQISSSSDSWFILGSGVLGASLLLGGEKTKKKLKKNNIRRNTKKRKNKHNKK